MNLPLVLIVDDNPENLTIIGELLQPHYAVRAANSGARALRLARLAPLPDLILLDVMMPEMDGYQVLTQLRQDPATAAIPVIFLTALDSAEDEERGLLQGAMDYIAKPIRPPILLARVRTQIELGQARQLMRDRNQWLEAEVARRMAETLQIQDVTIHALARLAETRDSETGNHLLRTQAYVRTLASRLQRDPRFAGQIDDQLVTLLAKSAPLHDIGKVGIPDSVLRKPGRLSAEEWAVMQTHARIGADAIAQAERDVAHPVAFLQVAKQIARSHHERWDGLGYPDGLAGEAIPLPARLMALADVYDALISRRIYKPAFSLQQARAMILAERGKHFDPAVVDAFADCAAEFEAIARRFADGAAVAGPAAETAAETAAVAAPTPSIPQASTDPAPHRASTAAQAADPLGSIPGLTLSCALLYLPGRDLLFARVLRQYVEHYADAGRAVAQAVADRQWTEAVRLLHGLRGACGAIGAGALAGQALALEQALLAASAGADMAGVVAAGAAGAAAAQTVAGTPPDLPTLLALAQHWRLANEALVRAIAERLPALADPVQPAPVPAG